MTPNRRTVETYMEGFRRTDREQILSCLTADVRWTIPGFLRRRPEGDLAVAWDDPAMVIRRATSQDSEALGRLGALLMEVHYGFDGRRFLAPGEGAAAGYARFLLSQLRDASCAVFVAELDGAVVGYCYAGIEPLSWKELRDEAGFIHDLVLEPAARRRGAGRALLEAAIEWFRERGQARAMLWTSPANDAARDLFAQSGFRPTMIEMTRELHSE